ncbi:hypothetical protein EYF80_011035 [Liparis tanakae]|uniref:Uncharacterized protein n=1 Tax=Liparis tanakae TaxID=230148 RepID=A0A4Z2ILY3_9TELE|nr:hypothetical protein EYF80_011035 [Liparis tanakae]
MYFKKHWSINTSLKSSYKLLSIKLAVGIWKPPLGSAMAAPVLRMPDPVTCPRFPEVSEDPSPDHIREPLCKPAKRRLHPTDVRQTSGWPAAFGGLTGGPLAAG